MVERSTAWSTGVWVLLCAGLAGVVVLELSNSLPLAPEVTAAPPAAPMPKTAAETVVFEPPPFTAVEDIAARPLFLESRRPYVPPASDAAEEALAAPEERLPVELVGTLVTEQIRAALLQPEGQTARWRRAGEEIAGWQVDSIERDRITLRLDDEIETLKLRADLAGPTKPVKRAEKRAQSQPVKDQTEADQATDEPAEKPDK